MWSNGKVTLRRLTTADSDFLSDIYNHPALVENLGGSAVLPNETPGQFADRIISSCVFIFTIRLPSTPDRIIGDCALHHWDPQNRTIEVGGSLFPEYWGQGYMEAAFELLTEIAKQELGVKTLMGITKTKNTQALRFAQKLGFVIYSADEHNTMIRKEI